MKFSIIKKAALPLISLCLVLQSCEKNIETVYAQKTDFTNSATAQVYIATVNASRNHVYVDGNKVSGAILSSGSLFPPVAPGFDVAPGIKAFLVRDTSGTSTQIPLSFAENMQFGKNYTVFMYDTITTPKQKTVQTDIVIPSDNTARLRFANFVYNPTALPYAFDIFSKKRGTNIFTNVQLTDVTAFIPYTPAINDTFYIRATGTTTNLQNFNPSPAPGAFVDIQATLNPTAQRSYTLVFRGGFRASTTTNSTVRTLSVFTNY